MIPIDKKVFDKYFIDKYSYFEQRFRKPYIEKDVALGIIEFEIQKLKPIIFNLLEEYSKNQENDGEETLYYFEENIILKHTEKKNNIILKTNNIAKLFLFLFREYKRIDLFQLWMDNIRYKIQNKINHNIYDITLTDFIGTKYLKLVLNNYDKFSFYDEDIIQHIFSYKKFYFDENNLNQQLINKGIIGCRNPKISLPTIYKNDFNEDYFNLLELIEKFFTFTEGLKLVKCSIIDI